MNKSAAIIKLEEQRDEAQAAKDSLDAQAREQGTLIAELNGQIRSAEQKQGDDDAIKELRKRGGLDGGIAARTIAATMPDPERKARFEELAAELLPEE